MRVSCSASLTFCGVPTASASDVSPAFTAGNVLGTADMAGCGPAVTPPGSARPPSPPARRVGLLFALVGEGGKFALVLDGFDRLDRLGTGDSAVAVCGGGVGLRRAALIVLDRDQFTRHVPVGARAPRGTALGYPDAVGVVANALFEVLIGHRCLRFCQKTETTAAWFRHPPPDSIILSRRSMSSGIGSESSASYRRRSF